MVVWIRGERKGEEGKGEGRERSEGARQDFFRGGHWALDRGGQGLAQRSKAMQTQTHSSSKQSS